MEMFYWGNRARDNDWRIEQCNGRLQAVRCLVETGASLLFCILCLVLRKAVMPTELMNILLQTILPLLFYSRLESSIL